MSAKHMASYYKYGAKKSRQKQERLDKILSYVIIALGIYLVFG